MQVVHAIRLNRAERRLLEQRALPHIGIGVPEVQDGLGQDEARQHRLTTLRFVMSGDAVPRRRVLEALAYVEDAMGEAMAQSKPEHWHLLMGHTGDARSMLEAVERRSGRPDAAATVTLVADPLQFAQDMAANRAAQWRELGLAADLLQVALDACPEDLEFDADDGEVGVVQEGDPRHV